MKKQSNQKWILFICFLLTELFLVVSKCGIIQFGKVSITILQIPIIICTIILGLPQGLALAGVFGISTMLQAMSYPPESIDSEFQNPLISVIPRLIIPIVVWLVSKLLNRIANDDTPSAFIICSGLAAIFGSLANTFFVTLSLVLVAPQKLGITDTYEGSSILATNIIGANAIIEVIISVVCACIFVPLIYFLLFKKNKEKHYYPVSRTFHKWLLLFVALGFFSVSILFYGMQTSQNQQSAKNFLYEKCDDIVQNLQENQDSCVSKNWTVGEYGSVIIAKNKQILYSTSRDLIGTNMPEYKQEILKNSDNSYFNTEFNSTTGIGMLKQLDNYEVFLFMPDSEIYAGRDVFAAILLAVLSILFLIMYISISKLVQNKVVYKIQDVNASLSEIQKGDLNKKVDVSGNKEFVELSNGINSTVTALKKSTNEIVERINQEMNFARTIQVSTLPNSLQMKAHKDSVELFALMNPAKEVGGDFYDYYMIDDDKLAFLVADVSGKGISAAMFMMKAKTLIKSNSEQNLSVNEVLTLTNEELCKNNDAEMFVTCWMGILNLNTYILEYTSAGHNPPLIRMNGKEYEYLKIKPDFVLGGIDSVKYKKHTLKLSQNAEIFLYTDGVTEATNIREELYGDDRLIDELNSIKDESSQEICKKIYDSTIKFTGKAPQFDDVTTLSLKLKN